MESQDAPECPECGSAKLKRNDDGLLVCDECGVMCGGMKEETEDMDAFGRKVCAPPGVSTSIAELPCVLARRKLKRSALCRMGAG
jgi:uncharacterized Zn finger protein (UPF0148 family)